MRMVNGKLVILLVLMMVLAFAFLGCASEEETVGDEPTTPVEEEIETEIDSIKFATIMPGSIQDADYNTLGFIAVQDIGSEPDFYSLKW